MDLLKATRKLACLILYLNLATDEDLVFLWVKARLSCMFFQLELSHCFPPHYFYQSTHGVYSDLITEDFCVEEGFVTEVFRYRQGPNVLNTWHGIWYLKYYSTLYLFKWKWTKVLKYAHTFYFWDNPADKKAIQNQKVMNTVNTHLSSAVVLTSLQCTTKDHNSCCWLQAIVLNCPLWPFCPLLPPSLGSSIHHLYHLH